MNTHNVKTAASESTETWVKQNFDVHLSVRTNRRLSLAKLEGDLMKHRAMKALGVEAEDLFDDLQYAAEFVTTMIAMGVIVTPSGYELASSVRSLAIGLYPEAWKGLDLAWLQADAPERREAVRQSYIESARPFGVTVCGRMEFHEDDQNFGTYWQEREVCLGRADTIQEAMELLVTADQTGDWKMRDTGEDYWDEDFGRDMGPIGFSPEIAVITDLANRVVLRGNARTLEWSVPEADPAASERIAAQKAELLSQAALESGWDNYETARQLRRQAAMLDLTGVHAVWQDSPEVADALKRYMHPGFRPDETEIIEGGDQIESMS